MKRLKTSLISSLVAVPVLGLPIAGYIYSSTQTKQDTGTKTELQVTPTPSPVPTPVNIEVSLEKQSQELGNYVLTQMSVVSARMTEIRKQVLARQIVSVAMEIFQTHEERKQFVTLIAIESKFDSKAKSHMGATGLTQVMPQYAAEFAVKCGINKLDPSDLEVAEINLLIGACRFRTLLEIFKGQVSLALVAYNAGLHSNQVKQLQELRNLSTVETSSYLSKWMYVKERTNLELKNQETEQDE